MSQQLLNAVTKSYMKTDIPEFRAGDTVKVHVRIKEGEKEINAGKEEALKQIKAVSEDLALDVIKKIGISGIKASDIKAAIKDLEN